MLATKKRVGPSVGWNLAVLGLILFGGCTPPGPRAVLEGERLLRDGQFEKAIHRLEAGTQLLPRNAPAWNFLGLAYHYAGRTEEATKAYQQALALDRNLVAARFNLGSLYLDQQNVPAAVAELTTFTGLQPGSADGWLKLGTAQLRARQADAAEKSFHRVLTLNPRSPEALNGLGLAQMQRRRYQEAWQQFSAALREQPDYSPALLNSAIVSQQQLNNRAVALQKYREYLALKPAPPAQAEVRQIAGQLEIELRPPVRPANPAASNTLAQLPFAAKPLESPATNKPPAQTSAVKTPPPAPRVAPLTLTQSTSTPSGLPPTASAPPPRVFASNVVASNKTEFNPPPAAKKVELVKLDDEEPIKPVRDVALAEPIGTQKTETAAAKNGLASAKPTTISSSAQPGKEKPGLGTRLNPRNWFRANDNSLATSPSPGERESETARTRREQPAAPVGTPRYKYRSPTAPKPGNRGEAERLLAEGVQAQQQNRVSDAMLAYVRAIKADPSLFEAHYNLGVAAFEAGDLAQALNSYEFALALNPISVKARFNFAVALQKEDFPRDAAIELEKLLTINPSEARAHFTAANLYAQRLNEPRKARAHYVQLLQLEPQHPQATAIRFWLEANP
jgi:tetratricopeptide (TPR) repeat protein